MITFCNYESPFGPLRLYFSPIGLRAVVFMTSQQDGYSQPMPLSLLPEVSQLEPAQNHERASTACRELDSYFNGRLTDFTFPLDYATVGTEFQRSVWDALRSIPYGTTTTYGALAEKIGNVKAARAVGLANNRNPLAIVIPCHRVIGANGSLVGYAGGLPFKRSLLELEGVKLSASADATSTRDQILEAAINEFVKHSYGAARVDRIAAESGVNKRMIYHHFGSKEGLYKTILQGAEELKIDESLLLQLKTWQTLEHSSVNSDERATFLTELKSGVSDLMKENLIVGSWSPALIAWLLYLGRKLQSSLDDAKLASASEVLAVVRESFGKEPAAPKTENKTLGVAAGQKRTRKRLSAVIKRLDT